MIYNDSHAHLNLVLKIKMNEDCNAEDNPVQPWPYLPDGLQRAERIAGSGATLFYIDRYQPVATLDH